MALGDLFGQRWHVELDLRNIKTTLGMETLSCKTPDMCEKEVWVYIGMILLRRRREIGLFFRVFSLHRHHYAPQIREKLSSISHSPRDEPLSPTGY